jgi:hypothetical protein
MSVFVLGLMATGVVVGTHILISRLLQPRNHALVVARLSMVCVAASFIVLFFLRGGDEASAFTFWQDVVRLVLFEAALLATYLGLFTAVEDDGPSMSILMLLSEAGEKGCSLEECEAAMHNDLLFQSRIEAMRRDGWIVGAAGSCQLTGLGWWWARCFKLGHGLFGIPDRR